MRRLFFAILIVFASSVFATDPPTEDTVKIDFPFSGGLKNGSMQAAKLIKKIEATIYDKRVGWVQGIMFSKGSATITVHATDARTAYSQFSDVLKADPLMKGGKVTLLQGRESKTIDTIAY